MGGATARNARLAYAQAWLRFVGPPRTLVVYQGTQFMGEFIRGAERESPMLDTFQAERPQNNVITERSCGTLKAAYSRMRAQLGDEVRTEEDMDECMACVCWAVNARISTGGVSPLQRAVGCQPLVPGGLAHESPTLMSGAEAGEPDLGHILALRRAA